MSNSYKTTCPACSGSNLYVTPHNAKSYCFNCGYFAQEGKAEPLKRSERIKEIRELYTELARYYHSCLEPEHRLFLNKRGISDETIQKYQLGFVPQSHHILYDDLAVNHAGIARKNKTAFLGDRIVFPYMVNGVITDLRGRTLTQHIVPYLSPRGSAYFRGADYTFNHEALQYDRVVITEGEIKAIASNQAGIPSVAIPGIISLRPQLKQRVGQSFTICFDSQVNHWFDVVRAIQRLKKHFDNLLIATLPLMGRTKMDIDDFIKDFGIEAYKRVIDRAVPYNTWIKLVRV
jgi:DNA primase